MVTQTEAVPSLASPPVSLAALRPGTVGRIAEVAGAPDDATRLKSLGMCTGRHIQVASAGDPLIVRVLGTRIGVAARLASHVIVVPESTEPL